MLRLTLPFAAFIWLALSSRGLAQTNPFESDIRAFEQADLRTPPPTNSILFVGSSSIVRWETLARAFPAYNVLNRGFGGSEASDVLYFYDRIVLPYRPSLIVFYEGDNDLAAGRSVDQVFGDWTNFVDRVERDLPETHLLFIAVKPSPSRRQFLDKQNELNERIREFNARDPKLHFADVFHALLNSEGQPRADLVVSDLLHLNAAGYAIWESVIVPEVEAWAVAYPIEVRKPETNGLLIDFGASEATSGSGVAAVVHWNNVSATTGASSSATLSDLVTIQGTPSLASLRMLSRFNGANENGTVASADFPASATRDSLFGNTETFSGLANVTPRFQIAGLETGAAYRLKFYASRLAVGDNRETRYTVSGLTTNTVDLNVANNIDSTVVIASMEPDASGSLTIALSPGPNNNNANHFTYLGVLEIVPLAQPSAALLFDFGSSSSPTMAENAPAELSWNDVTPAVGASEFGKLTGLLSTNGAGTGIDLSILSPFNGANPNGTSASTRFPASATQDSLFGNQEVFNGLENVTPRFKLSGLSANGTYRLTFFASRTGVSDNRETLYTVTGATSGSATLDAANNVESVAVVDGIRPDANNEVIVQLSATANNNSANHFTYLGILQVDWSIPPSAPATLLQPVLEQNTFRFLLRGETGATYRIEESQDLVKWNEVQTLTLAAAAQPVSLTPAAQIAFFRLVRIEP